MSAAAIYSELDACDVGGIVRGEECHRRGDFLGFAEALRRDLLQQSLTKFLDVGFGNAKLSEEWRLDHAGADGIDADVAVDELEEEWQQGLPRLL